MRAFLVVVLIACGPAAPATQGVAYRADTLETELARLPVDASPASTIQRSRILRALGRQEQVIAQIETSLDGARRALDWRGMSELWRELGDVQIELARPQDALDTYTKRLTNAKSLDVTRDRAFAQVDLAYAFVMLSQWAPAQHALDDAEVLAKRDLEADAETLEKMAYVREKLLARDVAIELFERARALHARNGNATGEARAAISRAYLLALEQESSAPLGAGLDALAAKSRDPEARARLLRYRGEAMYLFDRQYPGCFEVALEGQPIAQSRGIRVLTKTMQVLASVCAAKSGDVKQAITSAEYAVAIAEEEWRATSVPSARQAVGFEALLLYRHLLSLNVKLPERERVPAAFAAMEKARGRSHVDAAVRAGAKLLATAVEVPPLLARDKKEIEAHLVALDKEIFAGKDDEAQLQRPRDALWALEDVKAAIAANNPLISRLHTPRPATLARARELLDDKSLLLALLMTNDQVIGIAVTKKTERLFVIEGGPSALAAQITDLRDNTLLDPKASEERVRSQTNAVYQKLLGPVKELVKSHERIIILPHGALSTLPFEALVDDDGKFLVENHVVTYSQSATLALEDARAKRTKEHKRAFVGLGDPVYDWAAFKAGRAEGVVAEARGPTRKGLERLPGTAREVKSIASLFGGDGKVYLRDQASEENVKAGVFGSSRIIHVASHGIFETDYQALMLTVRPDATEDGFVMPSEMAELKLDADLVVLSGCETGRAHEVLAEPVSGLALALRTAGARRMVVSLWPVEDNATVDLMKAFYTPLVKERSAYGAALAAAKRKLLATEKWRHPFFWAPFVVVGS